MAMVKEPKNVQKARSLLKSLDKKSMDEMSLDDLSKAQVAKEKISAWEKEGKVRNEIKTAAQELKSRAKKNGIPFSFTMQEKARQERKTQKNRHVKEHVMKLLTKTEEPKTPAEIAKAIHYDGNINSLLNAYVKHGDVKKVGKGRGCKYIIPSTA